MSPAVNLTERRRPQLTLVPQSTAAELEQKFYKLAALHHVCPTPENFCRMWGAYWRFHWAFVEGR